MAQKLIEIGETMRRKTPKQPQAHLFKRDLLEQINLDAPLLRLGRAVPGGTLEEHLAPLHADTDRPAKPVRLMVGLLILKQLESLSDERVIEQWIQNPYFQALCGERFSQWKFPCDPSDLPSGCAKWPIVFLRHTCPL